MLEKISNWWNADKIRMEQLEQLVRDQGTTISDLRETTSTMNQRVDAANAEAEKKKQELIEFEAKRAEELAEAERTDPHNSLEPWVEVKSERVDPIKGLVIELDWNDAFVQYLKDNGIVGRDDESTVQKWLALLYKDMIVGLEDQSISKSDIPTTPEFE